MTTSCWEYLIILFLICLLFLISLNKQQSANGNNGFFIIDLSYSQAIKGIACLFILMGHYMQRKTNSPYDQGIISNIIGMTTANIGLVWFMFISGYGLSLTTPKNLIKDLFKRIIKVYLPLLFVCIITTCFYACLPNIYTPEQTNILWISSDIANLHNGNYLPVIPHMLGWPDWYIYCIMIFYTLYYLSFYLSKKIKTVNPTIILTILMFLYFIWAYNTFGPPRAHWYRFIWVFLLGHLIARQKELPTSISILIILPFLSISLLENRIMLINYFIGIFTLLIISTLNKYYSIKRSSLLLYLGSISYFFYLSHIRIGYHTLTYLNIDSILIWIIFTILVSHILKYSYDIISKRYILNHLNNLLRSCFNKKI